MSREQSVVALEDVIKVKHYVLRSFICENCGYPLSSYENNKGEQHITCPKCGMEYKRKMLGRRHMRSDMYAPDDWTFVKD